MAVQYNHSTYKAGDTRILVFPDHYVAVAHTFLKDDPAATTVDGKKIIKQGTVYPANDDTALGVVFHDVDVTNGDQTQPLLIHGFLKEAALPQPLSADAKLVLPMLASMPLNPNP